MIVREIFIKEDKKKEREVKLNESPQVLNIPDAGTSHLAHAMTCFRHPPAFKPSRPC